MTKPQQRIPAEVQPAHDANVANTDAFAAKHLNAEYAAMFRQMAGKLARKRPLPLLTGKPASWAAGIAHAVGRTKEPITIWIFP